MHQRFVSLALVVSCALVLVSSSFAGGPFDESIVRVYATRRAPNVMQPWAKASPDSVTGTGFVIDKQRVITNAHVIDYASQIYLQANKSAEKVEARVIVSAPEVDLALLAVEDTSFFANRPAIPMLEGLPKIKSPVNVYGYPVGGEQISVTEGIISRIDFTRFQQGTMGLRLQIDAALNPGNSGGPAISDSKLVGVAFQVLQSAENVGYLIPVEEIAHFLKDVEDGKYDGKAYIYGEMQTIENDALRAKLALTKGTGGVLISRLPRVPADSPLKVGDIITHIGDLPLDQSAKIKVSDDLVLPFAYLAPQIEQDNKVKVKILRGGQPMDIAAPALRREPQLIPTLRGAYPRYFILGPLVFSVATREFFTGVGPRAGGLMMARSSPIFTRMMDEPDFENQELVVIAAPMFSHRITKGYSQPFASVVRAVNGTAVKNLAHLVELFRDSKDEYLEFEFADRFSEKIVFRRQEIIDATEEILTDNGIRKQYSDDLAAVWDKK